MAQYSFGTIDPNTKSGTALATDLNSWRDAVNSTHSGSTAPSYVTGSMLWSDTTSANFELKMYDGAQWIPVAVLDATNNVARVALDSAETSYITSTTAGQIRHVIANTTVATMRSTGLQFNIAAPVISDSNANELFSFTTVASAVNHIDIANAATGSGPILSTSGSDTNIDLILTTKGTGITRTITTSTATNTVIDVARIEARSTGTPATGIGAGLLFAVETAASVFDIGARIEAISTDVTSGSEDFDLSFKVMAAGAAATEAMRIRSTGVVDVDALSIAGTTVTATAAELNILDGVTATAAELNFVDGVTSAIQTQLNAKANLASPALTGTPTAPTAAAGTNTTQIATTAFVLANGSSIATINVQEFTTAGSATWTKPADAIYSEVTVVGGGQGGRPGTPFVMCGTPRASGSGGSAGGAAILSKLASALGATETVTVGAAGATNGGSGGTSSFGSHASATGGGATGGTGSGTGAQAITGNLGGGGNGAASAAFDRAETRGGSSVAGPGGIDSSNGTRGGGGGGGDSVATSGTGGAGYVRVVTYCS